MLYAEDGSAYIDAVASWWVNLHGHAHPYIARKVAEQLQTLEHEIMTRLEGLLLVTLSGEATQQPQLP